MTPGQRFARLVTDVVVRRPALWRLFRGRLRAYFDRIAGSWETRIGPHHLTPLAAALDGVPPPRRILDLGTGTGVGALFLAQRFPEAQVTGFDLSPAMIAEARRKVTPELAGRVRFETADAERLPSEDGEFDLVALVNMIPFFDELARVTAPGGTVVFSFGRGPSTPIYVPPERLRDELGRRGFAEFAEFAPGDGTAFLARKAASS